MHRLERFPPPSHLTDLTVCEFLENQGRERRHRYYTLTGYLSFIRNENIDDAGRTGRYTSMDISQSGGFYPQADHQFYKDSVALIKFQDEYNDKAKPLKEGLLRKGPRKDDSKPPNRKSVRKDETSLSTVKPRGRRTKATGGQEQDEDGAQFMNDKTIKRGTKRKRKDDTEPGTSTSDLQPPPKKGRALEQNPACSSDMYKGTAVQIPESPRNGHSETLTVPRVEIVVSPDTSSNITGIRKHTELGLVEENHIEGLALGLPSPNFDRNAADMALSIPHQVPVLSEISAPVDGMLSSMSGTSAGPLALSSTPRVAPLVEYLVSYLRHSHSLSLTPVSACFPRLPWNSLWFKEKWRSIKQHPL